MSESTTDVEIVSYDAQAIRKRFRSWCSDANTCIGFNALDVGALLTEIDRLKREPSKAMALVAKTEELDLRHRRGWYPSERTLLEIVEDARKELRELKDAIRRNNYSRAFPELAHATSTLEAREEAADVFVCLLRVALRLGMSFNELDSEAVRKLKLRFEGAERLNV